MPQFEIPKTFKISDRSVALGAVAVCVKKAINHLDRVPFKELLTSRQIAAVIGISLAYFVHHSQDSELAPYRYKAKSNQVLWGSKKTIKELIRLSKSSEN